MVKLSHPAVERRLLIQGYEREDGSPQHLLAYLPEAERAAHLFRSSLRLPPISASRVKPLEGST